MTCANVLHVGTEDFFLQVGCGFLAFRGREFLVLLTIMLIGLPEIFRYVDGPFDHEFNLQRIRGASNFKLRTRKASVSRATWRTRMWARSTSLPYPWFSDTLARQRTSFN